MEIIKLIFLLFILSMSSCNNEVTNNRIILEKSNIIKLNVPFAPKERWVEIDPITNNEIIIGYLNTINKIYKYSTVNGSLIDSINIQWTRDTKGVSMDYTMLGSDLCLINRGTKNIFLYDKEVFFSQISFDSLELQETGSIDYYTPYDTGGIKFGDSCVILTTIYSEKSYQMPQYVKLCFTKKKKNITVLNTNILNRLDNGSNFLLGNWCYSIVGKQLYVANPFSDSIYVIDILKDTIMNIIPLVSNLSSSLKWNNLPFDKVSLLLQSKRHKEAFICKIHMYKNKQGIQKILVIISIPRDSPYEKDYLVQIYNEKNILLQEQIFEKIREEYILASSNILYIPFFSNNIITYEKYILP